MIRVLKLLGYLFLFVLLIFIYVLISSSGLVGKLPKDFDVIDFPRPQIQQNKIENQIFFGDLHVHTTFSQDAFLFSLPLVQGEGAHPPADPCNFDRFCSCFSTPTLFDPP